MTSRARAESAAVGGGGAATGAAPTGAAERPVLDNRSAPCAVGLIKAAQRMRELAPGAALEIWSKDRFAPVEIPLFAERDGYRVEQLPRGGRWPAHYFVFIVTKPAASTL